MKPLLIIVALAACGYGGWHLLTAGPVAAPHQPGFAAVLMPSEVPDNTVYIYAPLECPCEATQRANKLAEQLEAAGITTLRGQSYSISLPTATDEQRAMGDHGAALCNGEGPAVFVNGMGCDNPPLAVVVAEYKAFRKK